MWNENFNCMLTLSFYTFGYAYHHYNTTCESKCKRKHFPAYIHNYYVIGFIVYVTGFYKTARKIIKLSLAI